MVCLAGWFFWPRADARFVGTWNMEGASNLIELHGSGFAYFREVGETQAAFCMRWRVDGNKLNLGDREPGRALNMAVGLWNRVGLPLVVGEGRTFDIVAVEPDAITLSRPGMFPTRLVRQ